MNRKIYLVGSISCGRIDEQLYKQIIDFTQRTKTDRTSMQLAADHGLIREYKNARLKERQTMTQAKYYYEYYEAKICLKNGTLCLSPDRVKEKQYR